MDPQLSPILIAAISAGSIAIGSFLTFLGAIVIQLLASRKEQKQWLNQQSAEEKAWVRNEQKKEKEYLREAYQNSLRSLSVLLALEDKKDDESYRPEKIKQIYEVHKWVTSLLLRHSNSRLESILNDFTEDPREYEINRLRKQIIKLSKNEKSFYLNELKKIPEEIVDNESKRKPEVHNIQILISDDYRKEQIIEGVKIEPKYKFDIKWTEISKNQREKLSNLYFDSHKKIPLDLRLYTPIYRDGYKHVIIRGQEWNAKLNPKNETPTSIINAWETDYEKSYQEAKQSLKSQQNNKT